ncbi:MAG: hypothetical protein P9L94_07635 [Candidatus Hinthialibacter antarcticus]|nr:hypothetical protein [Candidatus Hinthialibacter antarcticus]
MNYAPPLSRLLIKCLASVLVLTMLAPSSHSVTSLESIVATDDGLLIVADKTEKKLVIISIHQDEVRTTVLPLSGEPTGLALSNDQSMVYVTCNDSTNTVYQYNIKNEKCDIVFFADNGACSPVVNSKNDRLYVLNRFGNSLSVCDLKQNQKIASLALSREPIASALTRDEMFLFVASHLPAGPAISDHVAAVVQVVNTRGLHLVKDIVLPNGSTCVKDICLSPDGAYIVVSHILAHYQLPTTQLERGWIVNNVLTIIDVKKQAIHETVILDNLDLGAANPWGIEFSDSGHLLVAHSGTNEISVIDYAEMMSEIEKRRQRTIKPYGHQNDSDSEIGDTVPVPFDMTFLSGMRKRLKISGIGPRQIATVGQNAYITNYFSNNIAVLTMTEKDVKETLVVGVGAVAAVDEMDDVRRGEMIFHDAARCFQGWQSCATCHPDARVDGLNWDLLNDGVGNPKNTKSMLLAHKTPPAMSLGIRASAEVAVRAGFKHILFSVVSEEDANCVDMYLRSLQPLQNKQTDKQASIQNGKRIFHSNKASCVNCHNGNLFTDLNQYDVGTQSPYDDQAVFDNPSLIELWRTAPYLHDGRAATMKDVLTTFNPIDKHGATSHLSEQEIADLEAYLLSL